jgi:hypothetical protein
MVLATIAKIYSLAMVLATIAKNFFLSFLLYPPVFSSHFTEIAQHSQLIVFITGKYIIP